MASLELVQLMEQGLKQKVGQKEVHNYNKELAIKAQLFQLRSLQHQIAHFIQENEAENGSQSNRGSANKLMGADGNSDHGTFMSRSVLRVRDKAKGVTKTYNQEELV
jgi:hypothetical protein